MGRSMRVRPGADHRGRLCCPLVTDTHSCDNLDPRPGGAVSSRGKFLVPESSINTARNRMKQGN